jgi:hypothetical protein
MLPQRVCEAVQRLAHPRFDYFATHRNKAVEMEMESAMAGMLLGVCLGGLAKEEPHCDYVMV